MKRFISSFVLSITMLFCFAQDVAIPPKSKLTMYVEYGGKGIKLGVLAFTDNNYRKYTPIENRELNVGLSKSIQTTGKITSQDIASAASSSYDAYQQLLTKYKDKGLSDNNVFFYTSSGVGVANNVQELCDAVKQKTSHNVYVVKETEESKYTIAGTIPYEKVDVALVLDQGGSNTKGGYIIKDGNSLTGVPTNFDLGSVRIADLIMSNYMTKHPDDPTEEKQEFVSGMNRCFDSLRIVIKRTFSNIEGAESRDELYLSGGAAYAITTLMSPEAPLNQQMIALNYDKLKSFLSDIQDRDYYKELKGKTFSDERTQKNYKNALGIYTQLQLISATKLLTTFVAALGGDDKKIFFNRYGLHSMPSMLIGRVLRGDIAKW
jgi:exopolyphosphatase/pppGpp-phosphohydrolase